MEIKDLTNKKFGKWLVLRPMFTMTDRNRVKWECQCECGTIAIQRGSDLISGNTKQCNPCSYKDIGEQMRLRHIKRFPPLEINSVYGRLTIIQFINKDEYNCKCSCGKVVIRKWWQLLKNKLPSCGCWAKEKLKELNESKRLTPSQRRVRENKKRRKLGPRFGAARRTARRRNVPFLLTKDQFEQLVSLPCVYGKNPLPISGGGSLDQKIAGLGYTVENAVPCCWRHNCMKGADLSYDDMMFLMENRPHLRECINYTFLTKNPIESIEAIDPV